MAEHAEDAEQHCDSALRRLGSALSYDIQPLEIFGQIVNEVRRHVGADLARLIRFEVDGTETLLADSRQALRPAAVEGVAARLARSAIYLEGRPWGTIVVGTTGRPLPHNADVRLADLTELLVPAISAAHSRAELVASRSRLVDASDRARQEIERNLHDGAQQRIVSLMLWMGAAQNGSHGTFDLAAAASMLKEILGDLQETARGIHPRVLSDRGLGPALRALARRSAVPVTLHDRVGERMPSTVEVAAYYVAAEVLTNAAKHARASQVDITSEVTDGALQIQIVDDGIGGATMSRGSGLLGLRDRVEALGGRFVLRSPASRGTEVICRLPLHRSTPG
jgi:signal transduction histidine kinase